jgi:tRNA nucleotidyltransferase (CCA-adding enzyme)
MRRMVASGEVDALVPERVWQETRKALSEERPSEFFRVLRETGALAKVFPEIDHLFGIPQPARHHPEVDTGEHTLMVVDQAARLTDDLSVRFAAVVHDLGKALTPADMLPRHHGHEERGVPLVRALCERLRVPRDYRELAEVVARYHLICHRAGELRPSTLLRLLEVTDAFRRPERFERFLLACEADARGRAGLEDRVYDQPVRLRAALEAAHGVDAGALAREGLVGPAIAAALRERRIKAIRAGLADA